MPKENQIYAPLAIPCTTPRIEKLESITDKLMSGDHVGLGYITMGELTINDAMVIAKAIDSVEKARYRARKSIDSLKNW